MAQPVLASAVIPGGDEFPLIIVLVIDDSGDDGLVAAIAEQNEIPSGTFAGGWRSEVRLVGDRDGDTIWFVLLDQSTELEREFEMVDWDISIPRAATEGEHWVALLPEELAGDLAVLNPLSLGGALVVEVDHEGATNALASLLHIRDVRSM